MCACVSRPPCVFLQSQAAEVMALLQDRMTEYAQTALLLSCAESTFELFDYDRLLM